ncbi:hypothetical protein BDFB_004726, partial [Asbolus verrucosus]
SSVVDEEATEAEEVTSSSTDHQERPTLRRKHLITPGVSKVIFKALKKEVRKIPERERLCVLLFDEIDIEPHLSYMRNEDYFVGFEDFGWVRTNNFADCATVFMLRSIYGQWKQPVAFAFYDWPMTRRTTIRFYKTIVKESKLAGLTIIASVCTHTSYNIQAIDKLLVQSKTKAPGIRDNLILVGEQEIVPLFDPSILLVSLRNNLVVNDLSYKKNGVAKVARWSHIKKAYEINRDLNITYLKKIGEMHVDSNYMNKANVTHCVQTFSRTMATFLDMIAGNISHQFPHNLPLEAKETAALLSFLDEIFDSVNGKLGQPGAHKPLRGLVSERSPHEKKWLEGKRMFSDMSFVGVKSKERTSVFAGWCRTLDGFVSLKRKLLDMGQVAFPARSFNLDPLGNCFELMKRLQRPGKVLTCRNFSSLYNTALTMKDVSAHCPPDSVCENDELSFLVSTQDFSQ